MSCEARFKVIEDQLLQMRFKMDLQSVGGLKVVCHHFDRDEYPCGFYEELDEVEELAACHCACNCYGDPADCDLLSSGDIKIGPDGEWVRNARV